MSSERSDLAPFGVVKNLFETVFVCLRPTYLLNFSGGPIHSLCYLATSGRSFFLMFCFPAHFFFLKYRSQLGAPSTYSAAGETFLLLILASLVALPPLLPVSSPSSKIPCLPHSPVHCLFHPHIVSCNCISKLPFANRNCLKSELGAGRPRSFKEPSSKMFQRQLFQKLRTTSEDKLKK